VHLIVGIDPGTTTAVALLDLSGNLVAMESSRDFGLSKVIECIIAHGMPSAVASDVNPPTEFALKLSTKLGCPLIAPKMSLRVAEKNELARKFQPANNHERDALSAALTVFNQFSTRFAKISSQGLGDDAKHRLLNGERIRARPAPAKPEGKAKSRERQTRKDKLIKSLEKRITELEAMLLDEAGDAAEGGDANEVSGEDYSKWAEATARLAGDSRLWEKSLKLKEEELGKLSKQLRSLQAVWVRAARGQVAPVGVFPEVYRGLTLVQGKISKGDAKILDEVRLAFAGNQGARKVLEDAGVVTAQASALSEVGGCYFIESKKLEKLFSNSPSSVERVVASYRKSRG